MRLINQHCSNISKSFMRLHINIEFFSTDKRLQRALTPVQRQRVFRAMHRPVMLSPLGRRALALYEDKFAVVFHINRGSHIAC